MCLSKLLTVWTFVCFLAQCCMSSIFFPASTEGFPKSLLSQGKPITLFLPLSHPNRVSQWLLTFFLICLTVLTLKRNTFYLQFYLIETQRVDMIKMRFWIRSKCIWITHYLASSLVVVNKSIYLLFHLYWELYFIFLRQERHPCVCSMDYLIAGMRTENLQVVKPWTRLYCSFKWS